MSVLTLTRRLILAIWLCLLALVVAAVVVAHGAPMLGYRLVIVRGPSMSPAIPVGAVLFEQRIPMTAIQAGDVVTFTLPNGTVVTHRVVRLASADGLLQVETKGDANNAADPTLHPASGISGIVRYSLPVAGFLLAFLSAPSGIISVISLLGSLLMSIWILEEMERDTRLARETEPQGDPAAGTANLEPAFDGTAPA